MLAGKCIRPIGRGAIARLPDPFDSTILLNTGSFVDHALAWPTSAACRLGAVLAASAGIRGEAQIPLGTCWRSPSVARPGRSLRQVVCGSVRLRSMR